MKPKTNIENVCELWPRFLAGERWFEKRAALGLPFDKDMAEFRKMVFDPLAEIINSMRDEDAERLLSELTAIEIYNKKRLDKI